MFKLLFYFIFLCFTFSIDCRLTSKSNSIHQNFTVNLDKINFDSQNYHNFLLQRANLQSMNLKYRSSVFVGKMYIGTPPQLQTVHFDSGSEYLYVASIYCNTKKMFKCFC